MWRKQVLTYNTAEKNTTIRYTNKDFCLALLCPSFYGLKKGNKHPLFSCLWTISVENHWLSRWLILCLSTFELVSIYSPRNAEFWPEHPGTQVLTLKIGSLEGGNCFHAWNKYDLNIRRLYRKGKTKWMSLEIYTTRQYLTVILFAATHIWLLPYLLPPLPGLFLIRKKQIIRVQKLYFIVLLSSPMANGL